MISKNQADYIKELFLNWEQDILPTNKDIAEKLKVANASASEMIKKLKKAGFIERDALLLTPKGMKIAEKIISNHRLWETFLIEKLGYGWEEVHEDATRLEMVSSEKMMNKLNEMLEKPKRCPHGKIIYTNNTELDGKDISMANVKVGNVYTLSAVQDDERLLKYLNEHKMQLGSQFVVINKNDYDNSITIKTDEKEMLITEKASKDMRVLQKNN